MIRHWLTCATVAVVVAGLFAFAGFCWCLWKVGLIPDSEYDPTFGVRDSVWDD